MINKKEMISKKAIICYSQILILVISMFAFSFLIYQSSAPLDKINEINNPGNISKNNLGINILKIIGLLIIQKIRQPILPMVSAVDIVQCCEKAKDGSICQEFMAANIQDKCAGTIFPGQCKEFSNCKPGCCYDKQEGTCAANSPQNSCTSGKWVDNAACNIPECSLGCCIIGNQAKFTTEQRCNKLSKSYGLTPKFDTNINNELQCLLFTETDKEGACVFDEGNCLFTTGGECKKKLGEFYSGYLCSNLKLNTICEKQKTTGCIEGKQGVYWFDSCGNPENIYDVNKEKAWNNGMVLSLANSCGANSANGNQNSASCGNCDYVFGSICGKFREGKDTKPSEGEYICKDLGCKVEIYGKTVNKRNGESWCIYDGTIGDGKDVVGSRHIKHACYNGEEVIEPCADYRNEICVQSDVKIENGVFTEAACRINRWRECAQINTEKDKDIKAEKCGKNSDCDLKQINVDDAFKFPVCTPKYPPGLDLKKNPDDAQMVCSQGSQKCTVLYVKKLSGWDCEVNCDCEKSEFTQKMNDYCISLGDCGGYVNILGDTDDAYTSKAGKIDLNQYKKYAKENPNQKPAEPGNYSDAIVQSSTTPEYDPENQGASATGAIAGAATGGVIGAVGGVLFVVKAGYAIGAITEGQYLQASAGAPTIGFWNGVGAGLGAAAGSFLAMKLMGGGMPADAALLVSVVSSVGGTVAGMSAGAAAGGASGGFSAFAAAAWAAFVWAFIIAVVIIMILKAFGVGDTKEKTITFRCMPWEAPTGGTNCDLCGGNSGKPCSEYRCSSLGQTCEFINTGTGEEKCVDNSPNDVSSPKISPLLGKITDGFKYNNVKDNGFELADNSNECIPEYTQVEYGIKTDKPSQCKMGTGVAQTYDEMEDYFGENNLYLTNHSSMMLLISPSAIQDQYNLTNEQMKSYGKMEFYVKCKSVNGIVNAVSYVIRTCVKPGPDLTAPHITNTNPVNGRYTAYNQTQQELQIWVNEPASCRWSIINKDYDLMTNEFSCETSLNSYSLYGWSCNTTLTNTNIDEKFYIRCKDQPGKTDNSSRNPMQESYEYNLFKSASALSIGSIEPAENQEIVSNTEPVTVELKADTSGGAEQGKAECSFSFTGSNFIRFFNTYSALHSQIFSTMTRGTYHVSVRCNDMAGNSAEKSTLFKVSVDNSGPIITRMFRDEGLKIFTDENAECRFGFGNDISWENATEMSGSELEHTADLELKTYYIQCKDIYGNNGRKVAIRPYTLNIAR